jgi:hypothetical protein
MNPMGNLCINTETIEEESINMGNLCISTETIEEESINMEEEKGEVTSEEIIIIDNISEEGHQIAIYENQFLAIGNYIGGFNKYKHKMYLFDLKSFGNQVVNLCIELSNILMEKKNINELQQKFMKLKTDFITLFYEKYMIGKLMKEKITDENLIYHINQVKKVKNYFRELDMESFSIDPSNGKFNCSLLWEWKSTLKEIEFHLERVGEQINRMEQKTSGLWARIQRRINGTPELEQLSDLPSCPQLMDCKKIHSLCM